MESFFGLGVYKEGASEWSSGIKWGWEGDPELPLVDALKDCLDGPHRGFDVLDGENVVVLHMEAAVGDAEVLGLLRSGVENVGEDWVLGRVSINFP